ncbi:MAG: ATP-dependent endonuclease [Deltaproteobacteria bacterium]|nr:MAG: ATP-dependent endonuclease [Deltaproteobacteria bacterium]
MYLNELHIEGYKGFRNSFSVFLRKGLNVIVGENASGKTAIIDAIRLLLREDEFGHSPVTESDFHRPFDPSQEPAQAFRLRAVFAALSDKEHVAFLPWSGMDGNASLTLLVDNKPNPRGRYKRTLWGGASQASMFEWELFDTINCVYLPPLRDAEARLSEGKSSRLARLLKNLQHQAIQEAKQKGAPLPLEKEVRKFNEQLSNDKDGAIAQANKLIQTRLLESLGSVFGQDTHIQFSEVSFSRIVESLRLLFFPNIGGASSPADFRALDENSLGYNNLLYLATVLAELTETHDETNYLRVLLIEEPEAHLHPQLQIRLLKYLENTAREKNVQVIVTTHSPVLASSVSLDTIIQLCVVNEKPRAIAIRSCGLTEHSKAFLNRWLDATKSTLLFARGIILVEGIAEAMLLPELAKIVLREHKELPETLEDAGVSVINMNGIYFKHFMQLFADLDGNGSENIPVRCACITDNDPPKDSQPTPSNPVKGQNPALDLQKTANASEWARLYSSPLRTFEYELAMEGSNLKVLIPVALSLVDTDGSIRKYYQELTEKKWSTESEDNKADAAMYLLQHIDKGEFAQALATQLVLSDEVVSVPEYIRKAIIWACGGNPDES